MINFFQAISTGGFQLYATDNTKVLQLHHSYINNKIIIYVQLNSCNSNSCNSKDNLNRTNSSDPSKFTSKPLQENSFNLNSHNSINHLNQTNFWVPWTYFSSYNSNFGFGVYFFHPSIFYFSKFECFNSVTIMFECFEIFKLFEFDCW